MGTALEYWPFVFFAFVSICIGMLYWDERRRRIALETRFAAVLDATQEANRIMRSVKLRAQKVEENLRADAEAIQAAALADKAQTIKQAQDDVKFIHADAQSRLQAAEQSEKVAEVRVEGLEAEAQGLRDQITQLQLDYSQKRSIFDALSKQVAIFDDKLAFAEMGVYERHFDFTDSDQFRAAIEETRNAQKRLISEANAVVCTTEWQVNGSRSEGKTMTNRNIKLTLRAFNNECDAAIANARWNNAIAMEKRIINAQNQIEKLNASNSIVIKGEFLALKLRELRLTHEYREKLKVEKEEKAEAARLAREEQRLLRDLEEAQKDEEHYAALLAKAKSEAESVTGQKLQAFSEQIRMLEKDLASARAKAERAQALAEKTTSGYVYIISNVGSFGEDVIKIGLTRRLDPMDRVKELGDASVPFVFDVHAIIYSEQAPALERALHAEFESSRINTQNFRKEFFRAPISSVHAAVKRLAPSAPFFTDIEAQEYRETIARRQAILDLEGARQQEELPIAI